MWWFLGPDVRTEQQAFSLATGIDRQNYPEIAVVFAVHPSTELMLAAMRSGIRDVVAPDTEAQQLRRASHGTCGPHRRVPKADPAPEEQGRSAKFHGDA